MCRCSFFNGHCACFIGALACYHLATLCMQTCQHIAKILPKTGDSHLILAFIAVAAEHQGGESEAVYLDTRPLLMNGFFSFLQIGGHSVTLTDQPNSTWKPSEGPTDTADSKESAMSEGLQARGTCRRRQIGCLRGHDVSEAPLFNRHGRRWEDLMNDGTRRQMVTNGLQMLTKALTWRAK
jgi:hypothetical protein